MESIVLPPRLKAGDRVRFVSPASTPTRSSVEHSVKVVEAMGLQAEIGTHVFDEYGYLAGRDEDRLADLNDAFRDPGIAAVIATRGGKGTYRIADGIDFAAIRKHPKLFVGFSENTVIHLALRKHCNLAGLHGATWNLEHGTRTAKSFRRALLTTDPVVVAADPAESTAALTTGGSASGILIGGNQDMIATAAGWMLPAFDGAILLVEAIEMRLGHIDRQLTMLENAGHLAGLKGVAVGQYVNCGSDAAIPGDWTVIDVLRDRLKRLGVPVLGGLPVGHGKQPVAVPVGTRATLDADGGRLRIDSCVQ